MLGDTTQSGPVLEGRHEDVLENEGVFFFCIRRIPAELSQIGRGWRAVFVCVLCRQGRYQPQKTIEV